MGKKARRGEAIGVREGTVTRGREWEGEAAGRVGRQAGTSRQVRRQGAPESRVHLGVQGDGCVGGIGWVCGIGWVELVEVEGAQYTGDCGAHCGRRVVGGRRGLKACKECCTCVPGLGVTTAALQRRHSLAAACGDAAEPRGGVREVGRPGAALGWGQCSAPAPTAARSGQRACCIGGGTSRRARPLVRLSTACSCGMRLLVHTSACYINVTFARVDAGKTERWSRPEVRCGAAVPQAAAQPAA